MRVPESQNSYPIELIEMRQKLIIKFVYPSINSGGQIWIHFYTPSFF